MEHEVVFIRELLSGDIQAWYDYLCLQEVFEHTSWNVQAQSELAHYVWKPEEFTPSSLLRFAVALKSTNRLVGTAGFHTVFPAKPNRGNCLRPYA